jgi:hypothetical protein
MLRREGGRVGRGDAVSEKVPGTLAVSPCVSLMVRYNCRSLCLADDRFYWSGRYSMLDFPGELCVLTDGWAIGIYRRHGMSHNVLDSSVDLLKSANRVWLLLPESTRTEAE